MINSELLSAVQGKKEKREIIHNVLHHNDKALVQTESDSQHIVQQ